jgi:AAA+ ATPase superfamily predicted ATPase
MISYVRNVDLNPFVYSRPLAPEDVIDREEETERLLALAAGGHYVRLSAPRRYGKTSLLRKVLQEADRREGMVPVLVDFYGILSLADVTIRIERAYAEQLRGRIRDMVDRLLGATGLGLSLSGYGISVKLQVDRKADPLPALHALLDLPLRFGREGGRRALIAFDEFQDATKVPELEALLRSHIQFQGDVASYVFSGSEPGLMRQVFETKAKPLYGQAEPVRLGRLADADIAVYVTERFRATGRDVSEALAPLLATAAGHPQRAMLLAHRLWEEVPRGEPATAERWQAALERTMTEVEPEFAALWRSLTVTEQKTVRALEEGGGSVYRTDVLRRLDLAASSAQEAARNLAERAELERVGRRYEIVDPLFALWVRGLRGPVA